MNERPPSEKNQPDDVEMSDFLKLLGKIFTKIGNAIASLFIGLYELLILFFLFIKRKIVWLALAFLVGIGYGFYTSSRSVYSSDMVVRVNFESNYFLHGKIDYFNSLIANSRFDDLARLFNINPTDAKGLVSFKISPIKNDIESAKLFRQTFLQTRRNHNYSFDTVWLRTLKFDKFKEQLTDSDYPLNTISVKSKQPDIFPKIQEGIVSSINNDPELKARIEVVKEIRRQDDSLLTHVLKNIDTLRQVYNKKLENESQNASTGGNQFLLGQSNLRNPELDLYDKSMIIKDELMELKMISSNEKEVLKLYSGFGNVGVPVSKWSGILYKAALAVLAAFAILLIIEFVKFLNKTEKGRLNLKTE